MPIMPILTLDLTVLSENPSYLRVMVSAMPNPIDILLKMTEKAPALVIWGQIGSDPRSITARPRDPDSDTVFLPSYCPIVARSYDWLCTWLHWHNAQCRYVCRYCTGCPAKLFTLGYLLFCGLLLMQIAKFGTFLKNSGKLIHDRHKNFENRFRNSWDNWGQSCHL